MKIFTRFFLCFVLVLSAAGVWAQENSITIDQAVEIAFKNSPEMRQKLSQIQKAEAAFAESKSLDNFTLTADLNHTFQGPKISIEFPGMGSAEMAPSYMTTAGATLVKPLDVVKKFSMIADLSGYQKEMDTLALYSSAQSLIFNVKQASLNYLRAKEAQGVAQSAVDSSDARHKNALAKFEAGSLPKFDVTRAEVELTNLRQMLISARNGLSTARAALNTVLGIDVSEPTDIQIVDVQTQEFSADVNALAADAYTKRPDARTVATAIEMSNKNLQLQKTGKKPSASVVGNYSYSFKTAGFSGDKYNWAAMLSVQMPVFDGGITRTKVDQAQADIDSADQMMQQLKLGIALDIKVASVNIADALERVTAAKAGVELAEEALRLAGVRYDAGISTLVEVTDAQSALSQARYNHVNALYDYAIAIADLQRATYTQPEIVQADALLGKN